MPLRPVTNLLPADWRRTVGTALRLRRRALGWSRERLAARAGYSRNHVNKIERGDVSLDALVLCCVALDVNPSDVLRAAGL